MASEMTERERKEFLERVGRFSCPIPGYDATCRKLMAWYAKNPSGGKRNGGVKKDVRGR